MTPRATETARTPVDYAVAQERQRALVERRRAGEIPDTLWLLEHPPTITWGTSGGRGTHFLRAEEEVRARGIGLCASERGGGVTFHEPGQLVGYLIVDLRGPQDRDMHAYLRQVERGLIDLLGGFGVACATVPGRTGVWVPGPPPRKVAAMGVRSKGWIASHGFALNVENALDGFGLIVPCGIRDAGVTSLAREVDAGALPPWEAVCAAAHGAMERALGRRLRWMMAAEGLAEG